MAGVCFIVLSNKTYRIRIHRFLRINSPAAVRCLLSVKFASKIGVKLREIFEEWYLLSSKCCRAGEFCENVTAKNRK